MWCANHGVGMKFSDEQRLIVYMLCGIQRALKVENELNPDFVEKVTATGEEWAIGEKYPWLLRSEELSEPDYVSETRSILQTFRTIRQSINNLDPADAARVAVALPPVFSSLMGSTETTSLSTLRPQA